MIDKIGDHEDWKDGHNAFRAKIWRKIREIEGRIVNIEDANSRKNRKASKL
jgi:DNA-binding transcriptional regulator WhiA